MSTYPDVTIIGGGVIGLTSAYFLARDGRQVTVLDRGEPGGEASWAGAGIVPPGNPERATSTADQLRAVSSAMFPELSRELAELTGIDNGYRRCGGVEFLDGRDEELTAAWEREGVRFTLLRSGDLKDIEPNLHPVTDLAVSFPDMAQVRNPRHLRALRVACEKVGVVVRHDEPVASISVDGDRVTGVRLESGEIVHSGAVLLAAGAWSERLLAPLGIQTGIHPVRGQIVLFRSPAPPITRVVLHGKHYLVPRPDGRTLVGSTEEPEAGFEKVNTPEAIGELSELAKQWVPALGKAEVERTWAGLRPGSPDGLPLIGRVAGYRDLYLNAGHFRAGIQLSIASARAIADLIQGKSVAIDLDFFSPGRTPLAGFRPAFRS